MHKLLRQRLLNNPKIKEKIEGDFSYEKEYYPERYYDEEKYKRRELNSRMNTNNKRYPNDYKSDEYRR